MHSTLPIPITHGRSALEHAIREATVALARVVELSVQARADFATRETAILEAGNEVCRQLMTADLQRVADAFPDEIVVAGLRYCRHQPGTVAYHSLCGDLVVTRHSYRQVDIRNGPTIIPLDLEAGLIDAATPALAFSVADGIAEVPSRTYEGFLRAAGRHPPSRSTIERLAKYVGGGMKRDIFAFETIARAQETLPAGAHAVSIGLDRTTVPMAEERPAGQPPSSRRKKRTKPRVRKAPHPIDVCYRMAYVGTVAVVDSHGDALVTRKYGASAEEGPDELVGRVMADVVRLRRQRMLPVVVVQDGAPELWGRMWDALRAAGIQKWHQVVDRFHVIQHMAAALAVVERRSDARQKLLDEWVAKLDRSDGAVGAFATWLDRSFYGKPCWRRIESHFTYLFGWSNCRSTRYHSMRKAGFPVASGVTEGACKSLITMRFKRSGQRWQQDGLTAVLTLRAVKQSGRLERIWPLFKGRFEAEIQSAA